VAIGTDGRHVMRFVRKGTVHELGTTDGHAVVAGSIVLHVRGGALLAQRLDVESGALTGRATALVTAAGTVEGRALVAASPRLLLVAPPSMRARELVWLEPDGTRGAPASDRGDYWQLRLAPDDRTAAVTLLEPQLRTLDVYAVPLQPGRVTMGVSLALAADSDPIWSPDGASILFRSLQVARRGSTRGSLAGRALRSSRCHSRSLARCRATGAAVRRAACCIRPPPARRHRPLRARSCERRQPAVATSRFNESDGRWSPDQRLLAYVSDEFGQPDVFVQDGQRVRASACRTPAAATHGGGATAARCSSCAGAEDRARGADDRAAVGVRPREHCAGARQSATSTRNTAAIACWRSCRRRRRRRRRSMRSSTGSRRCRNAGP
jgi:hypothetical protein